MNSTLTIRKEEQGFTLVELAIVMIIIGLLLGGLLKGQELITNARVTSTIAAVKNIDAATSGFRDKYDGLPGDLANNGAVSRLPNCLAAPCLVAAPDSNGQVQLGGGFGAAPTLEALAFFPQLSASGFASGIRAGAAPGGNAWGQNFPEADAGGGFHVSYMPGATLPNHLPAPANVNIRSGHYLAIHNSPNNGVLATAAGAALTPSMGFRIDNKMDDGLPTTGTIFAAGVAACVLAGPPVVYNEPVDTQNCNLYIRFQQ